MRNLLLVIFAVACSKGRATTPTLVTFELEGGKFTAQFPVEPRKPGQVFVQTPTGHNASKTPGGFQWQDETFGTVEIGITIPGQQSPAELAGTLEKRTQHLPDGDLTSGAAQRADGKGLSYEITVRRVIEGVPLTCQGMYLSKEQMDLVEKTCLSIKKKA